ncbi:hypothetical protein [Alkalibaculum bacchi]|uniref:hypothetical protein n=1 Tax=Alkalibaculum bacchi TaxID=645887 RepID=UPI0026F232F7|nr:hypothetical protein [Alkalibaculum bacchi]
MKSKFNFIPTIKKEDIVYIRQEKDGLISIAFDSPIEHKPLLFSNYEARFLSSCDGNKKVIDIIREITNEVESSLIENTKTSMELLNLLTELKVLYGKPNNSYLKLRSQKIGDFLITEVPYWDHQIYTEFCNNALRKRDKYFIYSKPDIIIYETVNYNAMLQQNIEMFFIKRQDEIVGLLLLNNESFNREYTLDMMICQKNNIETLRLKDLNKLLESPFERISIYTLHNDDRILELFESNHHSQYKLNNEFKDCETSFVSYLYYGGKNEIHKK